MHLNYTFSLFGYIITASQRKRCNIKKPIKIYRVVDQFGKGYKSTLDSEILNWTDMGMSKHISSGKYHQYRPLPEQDGLKPSFIRKYHLFAFKSVEDLQKWFLSADQALGAILGGRIEVYSISSSRVINGYNQLIFDKRKSLLIESYSMDFFLSENERKSTFDFKESYQDGIEMDIEPPLKLKGWYKENFRSF